MTDDLKAPLGREESRLVRQAAHVGMAEVDLLAAWRAMERAARHLHDLALYSELRWGDLANEMEIVRRALYRGTLIMRDRRRAWCEEILGVRIAWEVERK